MLCMSVSNSSRSGTAMANLISISTTKLAVPLGRGKRTPRAGGDDVRGVAPQLCFDGLAQTAHKPQKVQCDHSMTHMYLFERAIRSRERLRMPSCGAKLD